MQSAAFARPIMFHYTPAMPCPYVEGRTERRLVADIGGPRSGWAHDRLATIGFRRTQNLIYRPACPSCSACVPVRIRVDDFQWSKGFRRSLKRNQDVVGELRPSATTHEQYELFRAYQQNRHNGSEMSHMTRTDFDDMVERSPIDSRLVEYRARATGALLAVMLSDLQADGLSAVYSFFHQDYADRGLGTFMILDLVRRARARGRPYVYLGYWIAESRKMAYKTRYKPCEVFRNGRWQEYAGA